MLFYTVVRQFFKGDAEQHSVEIKDTLEDARKRYFSIIVTDLNDNDITWQAAYIIDSNGLMVEGRVFDRRAIDAEQEG